METEQQGKSNDAMGQHSIVELTLAVFRVTEHFSSHDTVRTLIRSNACRVLDLHARSVVGHADFSRVAEDLSGHISALRALLTVARTAPSRVRPINFEVLDRQYAALLAQIRRDASNTTGERPYPDPRNSSAENIPAVHNGTSSVRVSRLQRIPTPEHVEINTRQERILVVLRERQSLKISDLFGLFQGVSTKTIQRDLTDLVIRRMVQRSGEKRWTMYSVV